MAAVVLHGRADVETFAAVHRPRAANVRMVKDEYQRAGWADRVAHIVIVTVNVLVR
jgi:hypothetical protein